MNDLQRIDIPSGRIIIARVDPEAENSPLMTEEDREHLATLAAPARRAQWSTCRVILREELGEGAQLRYAPTGALILVSPIEGIRFVSLSHSDEWVAVMLSEGRCGVDIEALGRNFSRVASRYISHEERAQFEAQVGDHFEAIMWSAEEAIYKFGSNPGLDFIQDMVITGFDTTNQTITAELYGLATPTVHYHFVGDQILCYLSDNQ